MPGFGKLATGKNQLVNCSQHFHTCSQNAIYSLTIARLFVANNGPESTPLSLSGASLRAVVARFLNTKEDDMKLEEFVSGMYRVRDTAGVLLPGIVIGGNGSWSVELRGVSSHGFKTRLKAAAYLVLCNKPHGI